MDAINQRLVFLMDQYNLTSASFAARLGINRSSMSHIVSGRNKPGLEILQKLLMAFPDINAAWLINGNGDISSAGTESIKPSLFTGPKENPLPQKPKAVADNAQVKPEKDLDLLGTIENVYNELEAKNSEIEKLKTISKNQGSVKRITLYYANGSFEDFFPEK